MVTKWQFYKTSNFRSVCHRLFQKLNDDDYSLEVESFYKSIDNRIDYIDGANLIANDAIEQVILNGEARAYGMVVPVDWTESVLGQFSSQNAVIGEAIDVVREEWAKIASEGITQEELTAAQTYMTGSYPLRFDGNANIANIMVSMQLEGLPIDYIATRNDQIMAVTLDEANRVASELYQPDALHFVVVGQPEGVVSN